MRADSLSRRLRHAALLAACGLLASACAWFTDFKDQPDIDPWQSPADTIGARGNPQGSVPVTGRTAPEFLASYANGGPVLDQTLAALRNPVPADARSLDNGRKYFQINCAVCHGLAGGALPSAPGGGAMGDGPILKYGLYPPSLRTDKVRGYTDGYIWGVIRNGRGAMPSYDRIEEMDRWDVVNYVRALQQQNVTVPTTPAGKPGETGRTVPGYTRLGPTIPSPYLRPDGRVNLAPINEGASSGQGTTADSSSAGKTATPASPAPSAPPPSTSPAPATQPETHQ